MTPGLYRPESIPVHDTAPSEVEPPESTLLPCGCDALAGQECAICCPRPVHVAPKVAFLEQDRGNVLLEAYEATQGPRAKAYGPPELNWARTSRIAIALTGLDCLTPEVCVKVAMAMKQARLIQTPNHRDSMVDLAGYSWVLSEVVK